MKKFYALFTLLMIVALPASSYALLGVGVEAAVGAWQSAPSGTFQYKSEGIYDIEDDFGFDEESFPMARVKLDLPVIPKIYVMATPMKFEGSATQDISFLGGTVSADADIDLTYNLYDVGLYYGVPFLGLASLGKINIDAGFNLRIIELDAKATHAFGTESQSATVPVPMVYLGVGINIIKPLTIEAEVRILPISDLDLFSAIGRLKIDGPGPLFGALGYRIETADVDQDDFDIDIEFSGLFAEVGFSF